MNKEKCKRRPQETNKSVMLTIRVTPKISEWLKEKDFSPTGIFYESLNELGFKE